MRRHPLGAILFCLTALSGISMQSNSAATYTHPKPRPLSWEDILPSIARVESSNGLHPNSYLGPSFGRGPYHISDVCLETYNTQHWYGRRYTTKDMYIEAHARVVALWHLEWLGAIFTNCGQWRWKVLSAYNTGYVPLYKYGIINWDYVRAVCLTNLEAWRE
jgi:hypothetical protein